MSCSGSKMLAERVRNNIFEEIPSTDGSYMIKEGLSVINVYYREDEPSGGGGLVHLHCKKLVSLDRI